jgi:hypothetical protein
VSSQAGGLAACRCTAAIAASCSVGSRSGATEVVHDHAERPVQHGRRPQGGHRHALLSQVSENVVLAGERRHRVLEHHTRSAGQPEPFNTGQPPDPNRPNTAALSASTRGASVSSGSGVTAILK